MPWAFAGTLAKAAIASANNRNSMVPHTASGLFSVDEEKHQ